VGWITNELAALARDARPPDARAEEEHFNFGTETRGRCVDAAGIIGSMLHRYGFDDSDLPGRTVSEPTWSRQGLTVLDVCAQHPPFSWSMPRPAYRWGVVFPRRGMYHRRYERFEHVVDGNTGYFRRPLAEAAMAVPAVPAARSYQGTVVDVAESVLDQFPELTEVTGSLQITPPMHLTHLLLRRSIAGGADDFTVSMAVVELLGLALSGAGSPSWHPRMSTELSHRRIAGQACELLQEGCADRSLIDVARAVAVSPFHLTRIFRRVTGMTMSQYRSRLRVHAALERINCGETDLSTIAASIGFADHSHMTRTLVAQLGHTPSALRELLRRSEIETACWDGVGASHPSLR
jgi:AraC-like DNA-binding protein